MRLGLGRREAGRVQAEEEEDDILPPACSSEADVGAYLPLQKPPSPEKSTAGTKP
jgi:hypothetical protein